MHKRVAEYSDALPVSKIDLGSTARLPGDYAAGHALGVTYELSTLPDEAKLRADLQTIVRAYRALTYRGGIDAEVDSQSDVAEEFGIPADASVTETRKYVYHRKIERNRTAARQAKKFHGTRCQVCALDFGERYGDLGKGYIEAHHLRPIATLEEGVPVKYDVAGRLCSSLFKLPPDDPSVFQPK